MPQKLQIDYTNLVFAFIAFAGVTQFVICVRWCMDHYPDGYRWDSHFISDLGRMRTESGSENVEVSNSFSRATAILGLSLVPFMIAFPSLFGYGRTLLRFLGIVSSVGLIAIGQTPYDQYVDLHHIALGLWIVPMALMVIALPIVLKLESAAPDALIFLSLVLICATILYGLVGFRTGYVVMQKIVVVLSIMWLLVVAVSATMAARNSLSDRQQMLADQAEWYSRRIRRRGRT